MLPPLFATIGQYLASIFRGSRAEFLSLPLPIRDRTCEPVGANAGGPFSSPGRSDVGAVVLKEPLNLPSAIELIVSAYARPKQASA
jgi:hypothetical protein